MRAAFPYMDTIRLTLQPILETLGADVVVPPPPDREVLETGVRLAPELMCIPFKITLGNMKRCLDRGADTLVYVSGSWSCRFGYYGKLQSQILRDLGYRFRLLEATHEGIADVAREVVALSSGSLPRAVVRAGRAFRLGWYKARTVELAETLYRATAPRAAAPAEPRALLRSALSRVEAAGDARGLRVLQAALRGEFQRVRRNGRTAPLRVKLVGESYCVIEPYVNLNIIRHLAELGVEVDPFLTAYRWLGFHGFRIGKGDVARAKKLARRYWRMCVGGEDENSLGHGILAAQQGFDGIVHVHPFGCMPATVVQPAMQKMSADYGIPYLSVSLDEHTSETGLLTRLEAFVSMLERRRARKNAEFATRARGG